MSVDGLPVLGILLGDASGVGPELVAKTAASGFLREHCRPVIIGDLRVFRQGLEIAGVDAAHHAVERVADADWSRGIPVLDQKNQDPAEVEPGKVSTACGKAVLDAIHLACELCRSGEIEGFAFAPFNKTAMLDAGCTFESEHHLFANLFGVNQPFGEIGVLGDLMSTRTTSHIPIKRVSENLSVDRIYNAIVLSYRTLVGAGITEPRIGVSALNPHAGEEGHCGREEIDVIAPATRKAQADGIGATGPYPADTLYVRAFAGDFDGVVTMYHDQGQIAFKIKGFEDGVTVAGGQPFPIATCSHGTAHDIAGKGVASTRSFENAVKLVAKMAKTAAEAG